MEDKVTGRTVYGYDLKLPGMVHGKAVLSSRPHARIIRIDLEEARKLPGVLTIVTGRDLPFIHGESVKDKPFLAIDKVRFIGEPVAAVAAVDEETAQKAASLIRVEYEELPAYFDPKEAMKSGAHPIHEHYDSYEKAPFIRSAPFPNICHYSRLRYGSVEQGFSQSDLIFEERYEVPTIQHAAMEPHSAIAQVDENGKVVLWVANDAPHRAQTELAEALKLPLEKIRFINPYQGGGFGSKGGLKVEPLAVALALQLKGRPVRIKFNREETFTSTLTRHEAIIDIKSGVKKDGTLVAREMKIIWGTGAYAEKGPTVCIRGSMPAPGPYRIPHVKVDGYAVYTNKAVAGSFRGYGIPQGAWACEQHMDMIAQALAIDPLEIRLKNIFVEGDETYWGERLHGVGLKETLLKAAEAIEWGKKDQGIKGLRVEGLKGSRVKRGKGIACISKPTRTPTTSNAYVQVAGDGTVQVFASTVEIGQGANTILAMIAAEELKAPIDWVTVAQPDTDITPFDASTTSSRSTYHMGNAVRFAAIDAREKLVEIAAPMLEAERHALLVENGKICLRDAPQMALTFGEVIRRRFGANGSLQGRGSYTFTAGKDLDPETGQSSRASAFYMYAAQAAEVEVDEETGKVRVLRISAAHDVGKAINPLNCIQQIEGGLVMGYGAALHEQLITDANGRILNPSFLDYHLPTSLDIPELIPIIVEAPEAEGPYGAKGLGEPGLAPTAAAIGNAVFDAIGVRIRELPLTPERVYRALQQQKKGAA